TRIDWIGPCAQPPTSRQSVAEIVQVPSAVPSTSQVGSPSWHLIRRLPSASGTPATRQAARQLSAARARAGLGAVANATSTVRRGATCSVFKLVFSFHRGDGRGRPGHTTGVETRRPSSFPSEGLPCWLSRAGFLTRGSPSSGSFPPLTGQWL